MKLSMSLVFISLITIPLFINASLTTEPCGNLIGQTPCEEVDPNEFVAASSKIDTAKVYAEQMATAEVAPRETKKPLKTNGRWSDTTNWSNGVLPDLTDNVVIPFGTTLTIDSNAAANNIVVRGILTASDTANIILRARMLMVMGEGSKFQVGSEAAPFSKDFTLILIGNMPQRNFHGAGSKFLMAMSGGEIRMHGTPKVSWTKLSGSVAAGASTITVANPVDWDIGSRIVIASSESPSRLDPALGTEERIVRAKSSDGRTLTLNAPLTYRHVGVIQTYSNKNKSWQLDQRAEVGLLSHNVRVQGDVSSPTNGFGGHIMIMGSADNTATGKFGRGYFSNIELTQMGQKPQGCAVVAGVRQCTFTGLGRYPIHWHLVQDQGAGQYFKNSSIHHAYNRGITVHGTDHLLIERNVIFDTIGHTVFLEDGGERFNKFYYNLALLTRRPAAGEEVLPSDNSIQPKVSSPAMFWITNPNNEFIGNVAAGTYGAAYWFVFPNGPLGPSKGLNYFANVNSTTEPLGIFRNNTAHSAVDGLDVANSIIPENNMLTRAHDFWLPEKPVVLRNFTSYANDTSFYGGGKNTSTVPGKVILEELIVADSLRALFISGFAMINNSLFVADSGNKTGHGSIAYTQYAGNSGRVQNSHYVGYHTNRSTFFAGLPTVTRFGHHFSGLSFEPNVPPSMILDDCSSGPCDASTRNMIATDEDGSLTFAGGARSITSNMPIVVTPSSIPWINNHNIASNTYISPYFYASKVVKSLAPGMLWQRAGNGSAAAHFDVTGGTYFTIPAITDPSFAYKTTESYDVPTCIVKASVTEFVLGDSVTFTWTTKGKDIISAKMNDLGSRGFELTPASGGSITIQPKGSFVYVLRVLDDRGLTGTCAVAITRKL